METTSLRFSEQNTAQNNNGTESSGVQETAICSLFCKSTAKIGSNKRQGAVSALAIVCICVNIEIFGPQFSQ
jgi:hypothetical protein